MTANLQTEKFQIPLEGGHFFRLYPYQGTPFI
jgi:hypothetical protein